MQIPQWKLIMCATSCVLHACTHFIALTNNNGNNILPGPPRGLWGPRANTKSGTPFIDCVRGVWGARPQEILRFYLLWSVFWGLLRLLFAHAYSPYSAYIHASYSLHLRFQIEKYHVRGLAAAAQRSHKIKCALFEVCSSSVRANQKSRLSWTWNQQYSETNLLKKLDGDLNDEPDLIWRVQHCLGLLSHWGPGQTAPVAPLCRRHCVLLEKALSVFSQLFLMMSIQECMRRRDA